MFLLCFEMLSTNKDLIIFYVLFMPCELGSFLVLLLYRWLLPSMQLLRNHRPNVHVLILTTSGKQK